jgi:hypothetical protein
MYIRWDTPSDQQVIFNFKTEFSSIKLPENLGVSKQGLIDGLP